MRKAAICTVLALTVLTAACGTSSGNPSAVEANTVATSTTTEDGTTPSRSTDTTPSEPAGTTPSRPAASTPSTTPMTFQIKWDKAKEGLQRGTIEVPIDYDDPSLGTFTLDLTRHLATNHDERIGTLLVNPGGPGFGGQVLAERAGVVYDKALLERFDILGWDPRGTGLSSPAVDCFDDYDHFFNDPTLTGDAAAARQEDLTLGKERTDDCVTKNDEILQHVGTNDSARDMDAIRQALGEEQISYFGFSYGSELGATWATLFPDTVRATVLDGAADPNQDLAEAQLTQSKAFEASLATFLAQCSADPDCKFHNDGDAEGAYDALMASITAEPLPALEGRPDLSRVAAITGVSEAMYTDTLWPTLAKALAQAQGGDGSGLMKLYDQYYQRHSDGTYDNSLEAFNVIRCMDSSDRPTVEESDAIAAELHEVAPRLSPDSFGSYFCTFYPETDSPRVKIAGIGAGPILVVGTSGDPATPVDGSRNMAKALEHGVFLLVDANQHTGYGTNDCVDDAVNDYLIDPTNVPADGLECK